MASYSNVRDYFQGKLGSLVYSSHNGTKYVKVFVPPSDPKTPAQLIVRTAFSTLAHIGKSLYELALKPYTFPKPLKETAYNVFIHTNKGCFSQTWDYTKLKIFDGPLYNPGFTNVTYNAALKTLKIEWDGADIANADAEDTGIFILIQDGDVIACQEEKRMEEELVIGLEETLAHQGQLWVYMVFAQKPGETKEGMVSHTVFRQITLPVIPRKGEIPEKTEPEPEEKH